MRRSTRAALGSLFAVLPLAGAGPTAHAAVITINRQQEPAPGTYYYPVNTQGQYSPGYFYVSADTTVHFTLMAQDGATLHILSDAVGTTELALPADLRRAGESQTIAIDDTAIQEGDVPLTAGWHKLYVEYTLLSARFATYETCCRLGYSDGALYDKVESVHCTMDFTPWSDIAPYTSVLTLSLQLPGGAPAVGDNVSWSVRVTSDAAGLSTLSPSGLTLAPATITDGAGQITATATWSPPAGYTGQAYIWVTCTDTSRASLETATPLPSGASTPGGACLSGVVRAGIRVRPGPLSRADPQPGCLGCTEPPAHASAWRPARQQAMESDPD